METWSQRGFAILVFEYYLNINLVKYMVNQSPGLISTGFRPPFLRLDFTGGKIFPRPVSHFAQYSTLIDHILVRIVKLCAFYLRYVKGILKYCR